jgi:lipoate-protein ligase A
MIPFMRLIDSPTCTDPAINLALEEYVLRNLALDEDLLLFYLNEPAVIIGKHQNALEEINLRFVREHGIPVLRRLSGGGAVYHDCGNLNYSFITDNRPENVLNFRKFTEPVVTALRSLGVRAELSGRSDLRVDGLKMSGNAQYLAAQRMVSHGTLLFDSDLTRLSQALKVSSGVIESRAVRSVRSQVTNLCPYLPVGFSISDLRQALLDSIFAGHTPIPRLELTEQDWRAVYALAESRYRSWDWNFGQSPVFRVRREIHTADGAIRVRVEVLNGRVTDFELSGVARADSAIIGLRSRLAGVRFTPEDFSQALSGSSIHEFASNLAIPAFLDGLFFGDKP